MRFMKQIGGPKTDYLGLTNLIYTVIIFLIGDESDNEEKSNM